MRISFSGGSGIFGNLIGTAFGLFFAVMGAFFVKQAWNSLQETKRMQDWARTPCIIQTSTVEDQGEDFRLVLSYSYTVDGKPYSSERYGKQDDLTAETIVEIRQARERWPQDSQHECYYNPEKPSDAVLRLPTVKDTRRHVGFTLLFPAFGLLFASIPWIRFIRGRKKSDESPGTNTKTMRKVPIIFGLLFTVIGLAMLKPLTFDPLMETQDAKHWDSVPATVVSSKVKSHSDDDGTTYSVYIAYEYQIDGEEFVGDRYTLMKVSSSGYDSKAEIVKQYPKGREISVFVNPKDPDESVINRDPSLSLLFCLFPLPFIAMGSLVLFFGLRHKKPTLDKAQSREQIVQLKAGSPKKKAYGLTLFTLVWLAIVYFLAISDAPLLFPIVFGFFGLILSGMTVHALLAIFNPGPTVEITPGNIHPGTSIAVRWRIDGRVDRIRTLTIKLQCVKITTETRRSGGESRTSTVKTPIYETDLMQTDSQHEIAQGTLQYTIPGDQPASRPGNESGIEWQFLFHGDITRWPDMKSELPFTVYPGD